MFGENEQKRLQVIYTNILSEILRNENLDKHLIGVDNAIKELKIIIEEERQKTDKPTPRLDDMLNDFYYLKHEIGERT